MRLGWVYLFLALMLLSMLLEVDAQRRLNRRSAKSKSNSLRARKTRLRSATINRKVSSSNNNNKLSTAVSKISSKKTTAVSVQARIVGGKATTISNVPYLVQVRRANTLCGGSLISTTWVLSAAHCVKGYSASNFYVLGGTSYLDGSDAVKRTVTFVATTPKFTKKRMNMDASLLKLNEAMTGTNIATISMATYNPKVGSKVNISGWGTTSEGGSVASQVRTAQVTVTSRVKCAKNYKSLITITGYMFCARGRDKDACSGDSGGGAVQNNEVVGIVSFGAGCARAKYPGVYTRVAQIRSWANKIMENN